jgi:hypothetical protein
MSILRCSNCGKIASECWGVLCHKETTCEFCDKPATRTVDVDYTDTGVVEKTAVCSDCFVEFSDRTAQRSGDADDYAAMRYQEYLDARDMGVFG